VDCPEILAHLDAIETDLLSLVQRMRVVRVELAAAVETSPQLESLLDANAVAKLLGVETAYLYGLARTHKIPSLKLGKYRRFSPVQVKKWLDRKAAT
jgi:excisionase family DNA binding protein